MSKSHHELQILDQLVFVTIKLFCAMKLTQVVKAMDSRCKDTIASKTQLNLKIVPSRPASESVDLQSGPGGLFAIAQIFV